MTDGRRSADSDNPEGYYEWEAIKQVGAHPEILQEAAGKAIKVISMLLPARHRYKAIFMDRPVEEVAASQWKMIENRDAAHPGASREKMAEMLRDHPLGPSTNPPSGSASEGPIWLYTPIGRGNEN